MRIPKSRYDSVDLYISESWMNRPEYNDNPFAIDQDLYDRMRQNGEFALSMLAQGSPVAL
jgi:glutamate--cysteine ligase catalytic subunit